MNMAFYSFDSHGRVIEVNENQIFHSQMVINTLQLQSIVTEDAVKKHFKEKLAYELALKIIETDRAKFTYNKDPLRDTVILKATVKL